MDLSSNPLASFKLRVADRHARLVFVGGRKADVEGEALERLLAVADPLLTHVSDRCDGPLRAVSVLLEDRVLRATYDAEAGVGVLRIDGDAFRREVAPLCAAISAPLRT